MLGLDIRNSHSHCHLKPPASATNRFWRCRRSAAMTAVVVGGGRREVDEEEAEELRRCLAPERLDVLEQMEPWVEAHVLPLLKPAETAWQPSDLVPDAAALGAEGFHAACVELRERAAAVPDAQLVCLVGNMVTEEALPTYQSMANRFESARDVTGLDGTAWARWIRGWSAEENRHGDVLSRYMYLSGRLDMRQVERTVHRLIQSGMAMHAPASPYHGFIYVAFQERATSIAHGNTGSPHLFAHYAAAAQQAGVYTASDYRGILEHLIKLWRVEDLSAGLSGEGRRARDYLCALPRKIRRMEEKVHDRAAQLRKSRRPSRSAGSSIGPSMSCFPS
ncbi:hypothetical protein GUJ93_ZPchr0010g10690 [Zizania palustris]|uniref:Acyl-[acyl-carrier-protein] desaturase n=1 Tax=Zizania palustris TaxID=103762 RepID=A0A8J5W909_ZIZPA|nr:hypothetical protein GUJ93_ZPchr0010g10690 [Zizania palustris]